MHQYFDFSLNAPGLETVHFLTLRRELRLSGDLEARFLASARNIRRQPAGADFPKALKSVLSDTDAPVLVIIRNPDLVLDEDLPERLAIALAALPDPESWSLAGAGGLGLGEARHLALYASANPAIPEGTSEHPLLDLMPDIYLLNADFTREVLARPHPALDAGFEPAMVAEGYLADRVSLFLPQLTAGIDGDLVSRDMVRLGAELTAHFAARLRGQAIETLSGPVNIAKPDHASDAVIERPDLAQCVNRTVGRFCTSVSLSIVTRTRFERPHLLQRLLTSISRARLSDMELEVILATDLPLETAEREFRMLQSLFVNLDLRLQHNAVTDTPSRVANLLGGLRAARKTHVVVMDDDDYVDLFAFETISRALFRGAQPLIITSNQVHEEEWELPGNEHAVLSHSAPVRHYPASDWRKMFSGTNALPVCALIIPRNFLIPRLARFAFDHDLSEDYALSLLLLTAPDLPPVHEIPDTFGHISLRGQENSVTMADRRPWVRDITGYLSALTKSRDVAGPGLWSLLSRQTGTQDTGATRSVADLRQSLDRRETDLKILRRENARLRAELAVLQEPAL